MSRSSGFKALSAVADRASFWLGALSGISIIAMVLVIAYSVVLRYILSSPVLGTNEIVQLLAVAVVMMGLPYTTSTDAHVRVDVLDNAIGRFGRFFGDILSRALAAGVLIVLVLRAFAKAGDAWRYGDATNMLGLPIWPFYGLIAFGMACCAALFILQLLLVLASWRSPK